VSGLGWKLRRLRAMSAGEIVGRAATSARDRWFAPAWTRLSPAGAYHALFPAPRKLFGGAKPVPPHARHELGLARAARWLPGANALPAPEGDALRAVAAALGRGEWSLFGHAVTLGDPVDWNANLLTGARWPDAPSRTLDYRHAGETGGAKFACELGRLTFLPDLALAARTGDTAAAARARALLAQWNARNPLGHGIHHTSGIEMAIRCATVSATLALLGETDAGSLDELMEPSLGLAAQQALWCRDHLSLGSSANNHLLSEYMAMAVMGGLWPELHGAKALLRAGREGLEREVLAQFHADGVNGEQAFGYLPFVWELALLGLRAADAAGLEPSVAVRERLLASLEFARVLRGPDGRAPQVGDEDDGRILLAGLETPRLDLVGNALAAWLGADALADTAQAYALALGLASKPARAAADGRHEFAAGGWTVWRERGLRATFDHGPLGLGPLAAHGHADALAITLWRGADGLVVDPGTLAYHEDEAARDESRGTPAHATVHFGGRSQSEMLGAFMWGRRAVVEPGGEGWRCRWWSGESHARTVHVADGVLTLDDRVTGRDATIVFPLAPGALARVEGATAVVESGESRATFAATGLGAWQLEPGRHAPRYSHRVPAQRLVARFAGDTAHTTITVGTRT
jgi:hypothetical protein